MKPKFILWGLLAVGGTLLFNVDVAHAEDAPQNPRNEEAYTCPMHPHVKSKEPGTCPICHMDLVPLQPKKIEEASRSDGKKKRIKFYRNPMNPEITSPTPMQDSMGMDYIPVEENETSNTTSVAGRDSFEVDAVQAQNLSLRKYMVKKTTLIEELAVSGRILSGSSIALQALEADALLIKSGQSFRFSSPGYPQEFRGRITNVDSALDPMSKTLRVMGTLSGGASLRPEASGVATIEIHLGEGVSVPDDAVMRTGHDDLVYVITGNQLAPRKVKLGAHLQGAFQVLNGLTAGEEISSGANFLVDSEAKIRGIHD